MCSGRGPAVPSATSFTQQTSPGPRLCQAPCKTLDLSLTTAPGSGPALETGGQRRECTEGCCSETQGGAGARTGLCCSRFSMILVVFLGF